MPNSNGERKQQMNKQLDEKFDATIERIEAKLDLLEHLVTEWTKIEEEQANSLAVEDDGEI